MPTKPEDRLFTVLTATKPGNPHVWLYTINVYIGPYVSIF